jgi:hypothetical protein
MISLALGKPPNHAWTILQDVSIVAVLIVLEFGLYAESLFLFTVLWSMILTALGYVWWKHDSLPRPLRLAALAVCGAFLLTTAGSTYFGIYDGKGRSWDKRALDRATGISNCLRKQWRQIETNPGDTPSRQIRPKGMEERIDRCMWRNDPKCQPSILLQKTDETIHVCASNGHQLYGLNPNVRRIIRVSLKDGKMLPPILGECKGKHYCK